MHALRWNYFVRRRAPSYGFAKFSHQLVYAREIVLMQRPLHKMQGQLWSRPIFATMAFGWLRCSYAHDVFPLEPTELTL